MYHLNLITYDQPIPLEGGGPGAGGLPGAGRIVGGGREGPPLEGGSLTGAGAGVGAGVVFCAFPLPPGRLGTPPGNIPPPGGPLEPGPK